MSLHKADHYMLIKDISNILNFSGKQIDSLMKDVFIHCKLINEGNYFYWRNYWCEGISLFLFLMLEQIHLLDFFWNGTLK